MKNYKRIFKWLPYVVCGHAFFDAIFVHWKGSTVYIVPTNRNY